MSPKNRQADVTRSCSTPALPANWPPEIKYLTDQTCTTAVTPEQQSTLGRPSPDSENLQKIPASSIKVPYPWLSITTIYEPPTHPARGQRGLFAAQDLPPNSFICLYLGLVHTNDAADTDPSSNYDLAFDREAGLSIDATHHGNESRMANDYRGISERPNAEFRDVLVQVPCAKRAGGVKWERRVAIFVLSAGRAGKRKVGVRAGEEVLVSYGKGFWDSRRDAGLLNEVDR
ncbi:hypothetical protein K431DRAFT_282421 [Polychaeton citri CBS 116435]|uniref:SET domain-containing protein n=1 Tax=Polychaeton citri CBS 116435 TaxID=1314669 RepID=A0A9P4UQ53_9PEZI|nr:hypothetical protein K431DRAFT_282421 [Polychaeton citri CBS 116435]